MRLYVHTGSGHYLGSTALVAAVSLEKARKEVRKLLDDSGLKDEELNIATFMPDKGEHADLLYFNSGDY